MLISDSRRMLFVHVQKTGGVSMDRMIRAQVDDIRVVTLRHATLGRILRTEPALRTYWTFGFVRNPWARMVSWWTMIEGWNRYATGREMPGHDQNEFWLACRKYSSFEEFVLQGSRDFRRLRLPQIDFLTTPTRRADFIGRTETYDADVRAIMARLDLPMLEEAERHNASRHGHYREAYTDQTRTRVAELFAKDIELFDYSF